MGNESKPYQRARLRATKPRLIIAGILLAMLVAGLVLCRDSRVVNPPFIIWTAALWVLAAFLLLFEFTVPRWWKGLQWGLCTLLCAICSFTITETLARNVLWDLRAGAVLATLLFTLALYALFFAVFGRLSTGIIAGSGVLLAVGLVSYFVMLFRGTPFVLPGDLYAIGTAASVAGSYSFRFDALFLLAVFQFVCLYLIAGRGDLVLRGRGRLWGRLGSAAVALVLIFTFTAKPVLAGLGVTPNRYAQTESMAQNGVLLYTLTEMAHARVVKPAGYSEEALDALQSVYPGDSAAAAGAVKPNIVLILSESWSDVHRQAGLETNIPVTPFLDEFRQRPDVVSGELLVPVFGGATVSTEFETLTGNTVAFSLSSSMYFQHIGKAESSPSIATTLNDLGYTSTAVHPFLETGWGRDLAYPKMGFSDFITIEDIEDEAEYLRYYANDDTSFGIIEEVLERDEAPSFVYCITMQNHGSYNYEGYEGAVEITNQAAELPLTSQYLSILHESDGAFERFIDEIDALEQPTVVLMYGDHLPMLGDEYNQYDTPFPADERHRTPYLMYANYEGAFTGYAESMEGKLMTTNYVTPSLLASVGLPQTGYYDFLLELKETYPTFALTWDTLGDEGFGGSVREGDPLVEEYQILQYNNIFDGEERRGALFNLPD